MTRVGPNRAIGAVTVIASIFNYTMDAASPPATQTAKSSGYESGGKAKDDTGRSFDDDVEAAKADGATLSMKESTADDRYNLKTR